MYPLRAIRPTRYSPELADAICTSIVEGRSLRNIAKTMDISVAAILHWLNEIPDFAAQYARAKEMQAEAEADRIKAIADEKPMMTTVIEGENFRTEKTQIDNAGIQRNRLRVDARKWIAAKLLPKKYGDSFVVNATITEPSDSASRLAALIAVAIGSPEPIAELPAEDGNRTLTE